MDEVRKAAFLYGWLSPVTSSVWREQEAISRYADGIRDDEDRRAMKDAAWKLREAAELLDAVSKRAEARAGW